MKRGIFAGQKGIFIPQEEWENGLWLDENQKIRFRELIEEQNKLIAELMADE